MPTHNIFDDQAPLKKRTEHRLREIFCEGVLESDGSRIAKTALLYAALTPLISIPIAIVSRFVHLLFFLGLWLAISDKISFIPNASELFWIVALFYIFYTQAVEIFAEILKGLIVGLTNGAFLKWCCRGYLEGKPQGNFAVGSDKNNEFTTALLDGVSPAHKANYNNLLDVFLESASPAGMARLKEYFEETSSTKN